MAKQAVKMRVQLTEKGTAKTIAGFFGNKEASVTVGVFGDKGTEPVEGDDSGMTLADLAAIHEFGLGNNPERSFLRSYFDANEVRIRQMLVKLVEIRIKKAVQSGKPITDADRRQMLDQLGLKIVSEIQARIAAGEIQPPLTQATIDRKGSSTPLIDKGQLRAGITHEVKVG
jgi:hypothetical protein